MKSVLMSIQPKWCELIANGKKTVEVRKTKPKIDVPFKVYIYCTLPPKEELFTHGGIREYAHELIRLQDGRIVYDYGMQLCCDIENRPYSQNNFLCRKVIGEFVCDKIKEIKSDAVYSKVFGGFDVRFNFDKYASCLTEEQIFNYIGEGKGYAWHISDLVIYDNPKELVEFHAPCDSKCDGMCYEGMGCCRVITRPPQSWCYVEELK